MNRITRVEVIDENGRSYVNWEDDNNVSWQFQDGGRTLKVFVNKVKPKSPAEEAYQKVYGEYPPTTPSVSNTEDERWSNFQKGYNAAQEPEKEQKWDVVRESKKWCEEHPDESDIVYFQKQVKGEFPQVSGETYYKSQYNKYFCDYDGDYDSDDDVSFMKMYEETTFTPEELQEKLNNE